VTKLFSIYYGTTTNKGNIYSPFQKALILPHADAEAKRKRSAFAARKYFKLAAVEHKEMGRTKPLSEQYST
jgi:hypothetical protein